MKNAIMIIQVIVSVVLALLILIQNKDEGLTATFQANQSFHTTRRGAERVIFYATIVFAALFMANSLAFVFIK
jgi:protein translocase SecG subunit